MHLHTHTDYSKLDGAIRVPDLIQAVKESEYPAVAITDHGTMAGVANLLLEGKEHGVKAIPGIEIYHMPDFSEAKERRSDSSAKNHHHMTLIALNDVGYRNLMKLSSYAAIHQNYGKPTVDDALLEKHSEGVVGMTGCLGSVVNQLLVQDKYEEALEYAKKHRDIFGAENYYVEIADHDIPEQHQILDMQVQLAEDLGVSLIATNDAHYMYKEEAFCHEVMLARQTGTNMTEPTKEEGGRRFAFNGSGHHLRTAEEMWELFPEDEYPNACQATVDLADRCEVIDIETGEFLIPHFILPEDYSGTEEEYLREKAFEGAVERWGDERGNIPQDKIDRLNYELEVIENLGYSGYTLIVAYDIVGFCKSSGIFVGPGRGSAAGSAVNYCVGITDVDPIVFDCDFERYLNPSRKSMPDVDVDIESGRQPEVVQHLAERYGEDRVALIGTVTIAKSKSALKSAASSLGYSKYGELLSKTWVEIRDGFGTIEQTMEKREPDPEAKHYHHWRANSAFRKLVNGDDTLKEIVEVAQFMEGGIFAYGKHPAGVIIAPAGATITDYVPVRLDGGMQVCEYDMRQIEKIGLIKFDALSLNCLNVVAGTIRHIERGTGERVDIYRIPLDDEATFRTLANGDTDGVFQLSGDSISDLTVRVAPTTIHDICAITALHRPGPMGSRYHHKYADIKNGRDKPDLIHKDMGELLKRTYGLPTYQEQIMAIARHYAGYSGPEADNFRRAVGKKDAEAIAAEEQRFKEGVTSNGFPQKVADDLWAMIPPFAEYAFNVAHSASYGLISYWTAWLKTNYTAEFAAANIDAVSRDKASSQITFARESNVNVFSPDINKSDHGCRSSRDSVWIGLSGITKCGEVAIAKILQAREEGGEFKSIVDFIARSGANEAQTYNLIMTGAFDSLHPSRKGLIDNLPEIVARGRSQRNRKNDALEAVSLFDMFDIEEPDDLEGINVDVPDYSTSVRIANEIESLGFVAGKHPMTIIRSKIEDLIKDGVIPEDAIEVGSYKPEELEGERITVFGIAASIEETNSNGRVRTIIIVENERSQNQRVVFFGKPAWNASVGSFVVISGDIRYYDNRGNINYDLIGTNGGFKAVSIDALGSGSAQMTTRTSRAESKGQDVPVATRKPVITKRRGREDRNTAESTSESNENLKIIHIRTETQMDALMDRIQELPEGDKGIIIAYRGKRIKADGYDYSEESIASIVREVRAQLL